MDFSFIYLALGYGIWERSTTGRSFQSSKLNIQSNGCGENAAEHTPMEQSCSEQDGVHCRSL